MPVFHLVVAPAKNPLTSPWFGICHIASRKSGLQSVRAVAIMKTAWIMSNCLTQMEGLRGAESAEIEIWCSATKTGGQDWSAEDALPAIKQTGKPDKKCADQQGARCRDQNPLGLQRFAFHDGGDQQVLAETGNGH